MAAAEIGFWSGAILYTPPAGAGPATDLEFHATDANGTNWVLLSVQGMDGAGTAGQVVQRAGDHGGYGAPQYHAPRTLTLIVQATAKSQALRDVARATMQQAVPVGVGGGSDLATFRYDEPVPVQIGVRRSGALTETYPTLNDVVFTVGLVAPDPRKYSTTLHQLVVNQGAAAAGLAPPWTPPITLPAGAPPMSVSCTNAGSFETRPTVVIQGPVTAPSIVNQVTGQAVTYSSLTLGATDVLTVDFLNRTATLNTAYRTADVASSWWALPPGATGVQLYGTASAGASMTVQWRDAWI